MIRNSLKKLATKQRKAFCQMAHSPAAAGYGLALLMVFLASTVLIGTSVQLMLGSSTGNYLGTSSQDNLSANAVAQTGMETVLADIQSDLDDGTPVTTSYSYNSSNISMPTDSGSLGGSRTVVGSFSGQVTAVLGNTYTVQVSATVNTSTITLTKTLTMVRNSKSLDVMTNANAAYSVRKVRSAYTGSALRVRRSTDNAEQDIGFDVNGNLNIDSLNTFLNANSMPLDSVGGAIAAYSTRRIRSAYTGPLLKVRRSSDSNQQDIGYTTNGDLDISSLLNFVGSGTGYVTKWYDQSGNGNDSTNSTTSAQPTIVTNGQVNLSNNRPTLSFNGSNYMPVSELAVNDFSILAVYNTQTYGPAGWVINNDAAFAGRNDYFLSVEGTNNGTCYQAGDVMATVGVGDNNNDGCFSVASQTIPSSSDVRLHWVAFTRQKASGNINVYTESASVGGNTPNRNTLSQAGTIKIGSLTGSVSEVIMYTSVLSESNRQLLQQNEGWYYNMAPVTKDATPSASVLGSPTNTYSLRKLGSVTKAIQVRRSGDNATQDIGFDTLGNLDVGALASFVGSNSGYVKIWYDQSGHGRNFSQSSNSLQPRIMASGVLDTVNGKPAIYFINYQNSLSGTSTNNIHDYSAFAMMKQANPANDFYIMCGSSGNYQLLKTRDNGTKVAFFSVDESGGDTMTSASYTNDLTKALTPIGIKRSGSTITGYVNGMTESMSPNITAIVNWALIGGLNTVNWSDGWLTEIIFYNNTAVSDAFANALMKNMNSYYAPTVPTAYVVKWYDQSGNGNDQVQYNTNMQPTLVMPRVGNMNTWPTIAFNGGQYLLSATGMPVNASYSKVAVFSMNNNGMPNNIISGNLSPNGHAFWMGNSNYLRMYHNAADFATSSLGMTTDTNYAIAATYSQTSPTKTGTVYRGNVSGGTGATGSSNTDPSISLGAYDHGQYQLDGTISEAAVFSRVLSATDRTTLYNDERGYFGAQ